MSGTCTSCGGPRTHYRSPVYGFARFGCHGWCARCYGRWLNNGKPASGPPPPRQGRGGGPHPGRVEDYAELRSWGLTREQAARRLGVTLRSALRYEAELRQREAAAA